MTRIFNVLLIVAAAAVLVIGCKPDYPNCKKDKHCREGEFCVNNLCQQCRDSADCPTGHECADGGCRKLPNYCASSADCAAGQVCRDNTCGPCMSDGDCSNGQVCADGLCITAECRSNEDCPAGLSCVNYRCKADEQVSALGTGDCSLDSIYFEFDSHEVDSTGRGVLDDNFQCLQKRGGKVTLEGHCDGAGTTEYNMALGDRRARMVKNLLGKMGLDSASMRVVSKGEEEATSGGANDKDRRVDFK